MDTDSVYKNRAKLRIDVDYAADCTSFECCPEELVFAMRDTKHDFTLGLITVLECLSIAEKEGYIPKLPDDWWSRIHRH